MRNERRVCGVAKTMGLLAAVIVLFLCQGAFSAGWTAEYEQPGEVSARGVLKPEQLKGPYHTVEDQVRHDGLFYRYTVQTPFGQYAPASTFALDVLIKELNAIAAMRKVETKDTAVESLKASGEKTVTGLKNLFTEPVDTLGGAAEGIGDLFDRASQTVGRRETTGAEDSKVAQALGFSKSKGEIASKFGVSVYSRNPALQEELDRLGWADYLGGISIGAATSVVPGVGGIVLTTSGSARLLNDAINNTPASKLWLQNKNKLVAMGFNADTVEFFLNNKAFNPALETVLVSALESMKGVANREIFIKVGMQASNPDMARTITEMAALLAGYHNRVEPLKSLAPMARVACGIKRDGSPVAALPVDNLLWSERIAGVARDMAAKRKGLAGAPELWVLGTVSDQARKGLTAAGWKVNERAGGKLMAPIKP